MKVAALYDIHGNLPALDAVLSEVRHERVDLIVVGGDVVPGPMPRQVVSRLLELDVPVRFIRGNGDRVVLAQLSGGTIDEVPEVFREVIRWTADQLDTQSQQALANWPATYQTSIDGVGEVFFCHATPQNDFDCFTRVTPDDRVSRLFAGVTASVAICGHTHMQFDRRAGNLRIVNAGSVGMPFAHPAGAHWLLLGSGVELRQTMYDLAGAAEHIRATGFPQSELLAVRYVLNPPAEAESLAMFAPADLA